MFNILSRSANNLIFPKHPPLAPKPPFFVCNNESLTKDHRDTPLR